MPPEEQGPETPAEEQDASNLRDDSRLSDDSIGEIKFSVKKIKFKKAPGVLKQQANSRGSSASAGREQPPGGASGDAAASRQAAANRAGQEDIFDRTAQHIGRATAALNKLSKNKRLLFGLGGGTSLIIVLVVAIIALLPLKLEDFMKNELEQRVTNKVDYMMEKRIDKMVVRYLFERAGVQTGGGVYADSSLLKTVYGNWRLANFEKKFTANTGLKIEPVVDDGKISRGLKVTAADGTTQDFADMGKFEQYIGENRGSDARNFIREVTRDQTKWYQVIQRRNIRMFMKNAYNITKWSYFTDKTGKDAETETTSSLIEDAMTPYEEDAPQIANCALEGGSCPSDNGPPENPYNQQTITPDAPGNSSDSSTVSDTSSSISDAIAKAKQFTPSALVTKGLSKVLSKFMAEELASKISAKVVSGVGDLLIVDQAARLDHFFRSGQADSTVRALHKIEYATEFTQFLTIADNFKDPNKQMSTDELSSVMTLFTGAEQSAGYHEVIDHGTGGKKIDPSLGIDDSSQQIKNAYTNAAPVWNPAYGLLAGWYAAVDQTAAHHLVDLLNSAIGIVADGAVSALEAVFPPIRSLMNDIGGFMANAMLQLVKPAVDGTETGADLFNAIDAGASVVGQDFLHSLGGYALSPLVAAQMNQDVALNTTQDNPAPGSLTGRLFSTDYNNSAINRLAEIMPVSPSDAANQSMGAAFAVIKNPISLITGPLSLFSGTAHAATAADCGNGSLYGLTCFGATAADLNQPIDDAGLDVAAAKAASRLGTTVAQAEQSQAGLNALLNATLPQDCPFVPLGTLDRCRLDLQTLQSVNSTYTNEDDGGIGNSNSGGSTTAPTAPAGTTIDMSTLYQDSTSVACASGTTDLGTADGYHEGQLVKIRLCGLPNLSSSGTSVPNAHGQAAVNSRVSGAWYALVQAANQNGVHMAAISSFRTMAEQQSLCPCDGVTVARPGYSNHQMGLAIDFDVGGLCPVQGQSGCEAPASATWKWLHAHAADYGIHQYSAEAWHWSPTGN